MLGPTIIDGKTLTAWSYAAVAIELFRRIVHFETKVVDSDESFESFCRFVMRKILPRELMMLAFDDWPKRGVTNGNRLTTPANRICSFLHSYSVLFAVSSIDYHS